MARPAAAPLERHSFLGRVGAGDTELYRGVRLELAIEALDVEGRMMSDLERAFVESGRQARDAEVVEARRTARRLRRRLSAVAAALVVAVVAGAVAIVQRNDANESEAAADEAAAVAEEQRAAADGAAAVAEEQRAAADGAAEAAQASARRADRGTRRPRRVTPPHATRHSGAARRRGLPSRRHGAYAVQPARHVHRRRTLPRRSPLRRTSAAGGIVLPDGESAYLTDQDGRLRPYDFDSGALGEALPAIGTTVDRFPDPRRVGGRPPCRAGIAV